MMLTDTQIQSVIEVPSEPKNNPRLWFESTHAIWRSGWSIHHEEVKLIVELDDVVGKRWVSVEVFDMSTDRRLARVALRAIDGAGFVVSAYPGPHDTLLYRAQHGDWPSDDLSCKVRCTTRRYSLPVRDREPWPDEYRDEVLKEPVDKVEEALASLGDEKD